MGRKSHYFLGKHPACDFVLGHPSISRRHAAIQFSEEDGCVYIIDLDSSHGIKVNKQSLERMQYSQIYVDDVIKLGKVVDTFCASFFQSMFKLLHPYFFPAPASQ